MPTNITLLTSCSLYYLYMASHYPLLYSIPIIIKMPFNYYLMATIIIVVVPFLARSFTIMELTTTTTTNFSLLVLVPFLARLFIMELTTIKLNLLALIKFK